MNIMNPEARKYLDQYCTGLMFGNQGSKMLVKFSNILLSPLDQNGEPIPMNISREERRRRMGDTRSVKDYWKDMFKDVKDIGRGLFKGEWDRGEKTDEL